MPHVVVKIHPGRSHAEKVVMAAGIASALHKTAGYEIGNVSVAVEEIERSDWMRTVYQHDIVERPDLLIKAPEYGPLANRPSPAATSSNEPMPRG